MKKQDVYALGYVYGLLAKRLENAGNKQFVNPANITNAMQMPLIYMGRIIKGATRSGVVTEDVDVQLIEALGFVSADAVDEVIPEVEQAEWVRGYYHGRAEKWMPGVSG